MNEGFLHRYFINNPGKRLQKWLHYFDIYERHFSRFRSKSPTVLEIGVCGGGSLEMWKSYFGPGSRVIGLDIDPACKAHESEGVEVFIGSQDNPVVLSEIIAKYGEIDIIIDDGSHLPHNIIGSFNQLYQHVSDDGLYLVEDLHTNYWPETEGGVGRQGTFIELIKGKIDELNAVHTRGVIPVNEFTRTTDAIVIYDSIIILERRKQGTRQDLVTIGLQ